MFLFIFCIYYTFVSSGCLLKLRNYWNSVFVLWFSVNFKTYLFPSKLPCQILSVSFDSLTIFPVLFIFLKFKEGYFFFVQLSTDSAVNEAFWWPKINIRLDSGPIDSTHEKCFQPKVPLNPLSGFHIVVRWSRKLDLCIFNVVYFQCNESFPS